MHFFFLSFFLSFHRLKCRVCGDAFETAYDDESEAWVYTNAVRARIIDHDADANTAVDDAMDDDDAEYATVKATCAEIVAVSNGCIRRSNLIDL